ncbi:hypothetical protein L6164_020234 [Bauhinia variegata]|uniref:Uncharacterized protein n=1 Tax=Bauhinia variegata TaxID=167791 RepID=A0ACB9MUR5_BAUVA|nr:hypothetical protein L6164_020234 [Bauhinia variegata]
MRLLVLILALVLLKASSEHCEKHATSDGVGSIISASQFNKMLNHRKDKDCESKGFYTYEAFITAARSFRGFGTTGDISTRKREIAAFLGQTSHQTNGRWFAVPQGPFDRGYCIVKENTSNAYCDPKFPCPPEKLYYGRGPIQLTYNYNYAKAGKAIEVDLINNPDLVAEDAVISFKTAIWLWMTPQTKKPSCHAVITNKWTPSSADKAAGRLPGYGVITNIISDECGHGADNDDADRAGYYTTYCDILGVSYGDNLNCFFQRPFIWD